MWEIQRVGLKNSNRIIKTIHTDMQVLALSAYLNFRCQEPSEEIDIPVCFSKWEKSRLIPSCLKCSNCFLNKAGLFLRNIQSTSCFEVHRSKKIALQVYFPGTLSVNNVLRWKLVDWDRWRRNRKGSSENLDRVCLSKIYSKMHLLTISA